MRIAVTTTTIITIHQSVSIHCHTAEPAPIPFGVLQGSVLGPLLFGIFQLLLPLSLESILSFTTHMLRTLSSSNLYSILKSQISLLLVEVLDNVKILFKFNFALRPQRPYGLLGMGSPGGHLDFHTAPDFVKTWMTLYKLKLTDDNTEAMLVSCSKSPTLFFSFLDYDYR